ncbi:MAG: coniferyl-alcohol dehydrogenase [Sphingomonadales bacterium]|nr:coniferyl-alcohol dehydrogenase [Sphingomonadales bacterium]
MTDRFGYAGKRVLVTGCTSGIGHATARLLLDAGARVHGIDWQPCSLDLARFSQLDLRDRHAIAQVVDAIDGPVDGLFNCAGLPPMRPWRDVMAVNFIGMRELTERVAQLMPAGGAVVTVGSNGGAMWRARLAELREFAATPGFDAALDWCERHEAPQANAYNVAKEAIVVWTLAQAAPMVACGVRINCTSPGSVQTPMLDAIAEVVPADRLDVVERPIGRRSSPEEQAQVLLFLNSDCASYINGVDLPVDGGFIAGRSIT